MGWGEKYREKEREGERETERDRNRQTATDRQTDRERDRQTETDREHAIHSAFYLFSCHMGIFSIFLFAFRSRNNPASQSTNHMH